MKFAFSTLAMEMWIRLLKYLLYVMVTISALSFDLFDYPLFCFQTTVYLHHYTSLLLETNDLQVILALSSQLWAQRNSFDSNSVN